MLRLTEVASQSVTFVKPVLRKAKTNTVNSINEMDGPSGHYLVVFSLDRPPLLAVGCRLARSRPFRRRQRRRWAERSSCPRFISVQDNKGNNCRNADAEAALQVLHPEKDLIRSEEGRLKPHDVRSGVHPEIKAEAEHENDRWERYLWQLNGLNRHRCLTAKLRSTPKSNTRHYSENIDEYFTDYDAARYDPTRLSWKRGRLPHKCPGKECHAK